MEKPQPIVEVASRSRQGAAGDRKRRSPLFGWLLIAPTILVLLGVTIFPLLYSLRLSFYRLELTASPVPQWVGLENYIKIFTDDPRFWGSLANTFYLVVTGVSIEMVVGLLLALALSRLTNGRKVITALLLIPVMMAPVVVGMQGIVIFNVQYGPLNYLLSLAGIDGPVWLGDANVALDSILLADIWQWTPFVIIIMAAGISALPTDLYEAAEVDGASRWQSFFYVTLPLLRPLIIVTILLRTIDIFKTFDTVYILTGGGPGNATETISFYTYLSGLNFYSFGYASALSYIQLIIMSIIATLFVRQMRKEAIQ